MNTKIRIVNLLLKSIGAGMCITLGLYTYLQLDAIIGSLMFSLGLLGVFTLGFYLYTGLVPYASIKSLPFLLGVIVGNVIGCTVLMPLQATDVAQVLLQSKLSEPLLAVFIEAALCNLLIYLACEANKQKNIIVVIMSVMTFVLCGFEHSIANVGLLVLARHISVEALVMLLVVFAGNAVGGIIIRKVHVGIHENCKDRKRLVE